MFFEKYRIRKGDMPTAIFKPNLISHVSRVDSKKPCTLVGDICVDVEILRPFSNFEGRRRNFEVVFPILKRDDVVDVDDVVTILRWIGYVRR